MTRRITSAPFARRTVGAGIAALALLGWAVLVPGGLFWSAVVAAGLVGALTTTVALVHSRSNPTLAQVVATAEGKAVAVPGGEEEP